jgi:hypothetical protein
MGKVDCFQVPGLMLYFRSKDHLPEHFHAYRLGEWEIRVYFLRCTSKHIDYDTKWKRRDEPPVPILRELLAGALAHREALILEWQKKVRPR